MFHQMIAAKRDAWFSSPDCTAIALVRHIPKNTSTNIIPMQMKTEENTRLIT